MISFPALVGIGIPAVEANVTNTVSLVPGYLSGSWAQRDDLRPQLSHSRLLAAVSAVGGLAGSVLLVSIPSDVFRSAVPYLILFSCALLIFQDPLRSKVSRAGRADGPVDPRASAHGRPLLLMSIFLAAAYGGFFGAGLGIVLLAVLGIFRHDPLAKLNALKQALSFVVNLIAAVFFLFSGKVVWAIVPVMAVASLIGGLLGGKLVPVIPERLLRRMVVIAGVVVAISFWIR